MWSSNEKDRFALANLTPTKSAQNNSLSITSLASFDESDFSFDCDSNTSLIAPSPVIRFAKKWINSVIVPPRTVNFIRIEGNNDFATVNDCNLIKQWKYEASPPAYLVNTVISTLEVTGILSQPLVDIISKAEHINSIKFRLCNIKCSISSFSSMIRSVFTTSLTFVGCEFSDAQIICDQFFIENRQIRKFVIGPANKETFSFPCLTNATLQVWRETVPKQIHLVNVQTSFTAEALADIAKGNNVDGRPVQIVSLGENGFSFEEQAFKNIIYDSSVQDKKISSTAGAYRKGKSFMNNIFVEYLEKSENGAKSGTWCNKNMKLDKFHWRGGREPDTTGIYLWSKPFIRKDKNGEEVVVFLMDTQGTFDSRSTIKQCATIFSLSVMLSSINIFNVSMNIQEDDLQNLVLFTEYAKLARSNCNEKPFQRILFLVRDWPNSEECAYGFEGGKQFLKSILKQTPEQAKEQKELRENLENSFQQKDCFLMPHPGLKIANNNKNTSIGDISAYNYIRYNVFSIHPFTGKTMKETFDESEARVQALRDAGYRVVNQMATYYYDDVFAFDKSDMGLSVKRVPSSDVGYNLKDLYVVWVKEYYKGVDRLVNNNMNNAVLLINSFDWEYRRNSIVKPVTVTEIRIGSNPVLVVKCLSFGRFPILSILSSDENVDVPNEAIEESGSGKTE